MSEPSTGADPADDILFQFRLDLEAARDPAAVVDAYCASHPQLADDIRTRARVLGLLVHEGARSPEALPGRLGEFRVLHLLYQGGMGQIWLAEQERLGRRVALKVIRPDRASPAARDRFRREQQALARLHQTHIVPIYAAGEERGVQFFAMPHVEGVALHQVVAAATRAEAGTRDTPPLGEWARRLAPGADRSAGSSNVGEAHPPKPNNHPLRRPLPMAYYRSVAEALAGAAEALDHAHRAGVLHRDVKPGNLMVDRLGRCFVIDFGLAGAVGEGAAADSDLAAAHLTDGGFLGTPQYASPEQWRGDRVDARVDVWGLGVTLYELLTLQRAFEGATAAHVTAEEPPRPTSLVVGLPADLEAVCLKAIRKAPGQRYPSAGAFADDLRRWLGGFPTVARPAWPPRRAWAWAKRNPGWAGSLAAALLALAVVAGVVVQSEKTRADAAEAELLLHQLRLGRQGDHASGWSEDAWERVRTVARLRRDQPVRDEAAATLPGLDARVARAFVGFGATTQAFDRDSRRLLMGGWEHQPARLWPGGLADPLLSRQPGEGPVAFSAKGTPIQLVALASGGPLLVWDVAIQTVLMELRANLPTRPVALALAPGGMVAAAAFPGAEGGGEVVVWDLAAGRVRHRAPFGAKVVALSADGEALAAAGEGGEVGLWELAGGRRVGTLKAMRTEVHCLAFGPHPWRSPEGLALAGWRLAVGGDGGSLTVWDLAHLNLAAHCRGSQHDVRAVAFNPDGTLLASAGRKETKIWDAATGRLLLDVKGSDTGTNTLAGVAFSPDGARLAVAALPAFGDRGGVAVWELEDGRGLRSLRGLAGEPVRALASPDGSLIAALGPDWRVAVWDRRSGRLRHLFDAPRGRFADNAALAIDPATSRLAFAAGKEARLWDLVGGDVLASWDLPPGLSDALAFDGDTLLSIRQEEGGSGRVVRFRELARGRAPRLVKERTDFARQVLAVVPSPDGCHVAVEGTGGDGRRWVKVFRAATGAEVASRAVEAYPGVAGGPAFDGSLLAYYPANRLEAAVLDVTTGRDVRRGGPIPDALDTAVGRASRWHVRGPGPALFRTGATEPLAALAGLSRATTEVVEGPGGTWLAWGCADGTVALADADEVQRRLTSVNLGW